MHRIGQGVAAEQTQRKSDVKGGNKHTFYLMRHLDIILTYRRSEPSKEGNILSYAYYGQDLCTTCFLRFLDVRGLDLFFTSSLKQFLGENKNFPQA